MSVCLWFSAGALQEHYYPCLWCISAPEWNSKKVDVKRRNEDIVPLLFRLYGSWHQSKREREWEEAWLALCPCPTAVSLLRESERVCVCVIEREPTQHLSRAMVMEKKKGTRWTSGREKESRQMGCILPLSTPFSFSPSVSFPLLSLSFMYWLGGWFSSSVSVFLGVVSLQTPVLTSEKCQTTHSTGRTASVDGVFLPNNNTYTHRFYLCLGMIFLQADPLGIYSTFLKVLFFCM